MTIAVDLGRKAPKQTNKQTFDIDLVFYDRLHGLTRACISESFDFKVDFLFKCICAKS